MWSPDAKQLMVNGWPASFKYAVTASLTVVDVATGERRRFHPLEPTAAMGLVDPAGVPSPDRAPPRPPSRLPWSEFLRRVFREDLLVCPRCTGPMTVLATLTDPAVVAAILAHLSLPTEPPPVAGARPPPQVPFWPGGCDPPPDLDAYEPA